MSEPDMNQTVSTCFVIQLRSPKLSEPVRTSKTHKPKANWGSPDVHHVRIQQRESNQKPFSRRISSLSAPHSCRFRAGVTGRDDFLPHSSRLTGRSPDRHSHQRGKREGAYVGGQGPTTSFRRASLPVAKAEN